MSRFSLASPPPDAPPGARIAIVGAGPAGLMAAEVLAARGHRVTVYERLPAPARKLLMAGRGGLNITHSEPLPRFMERYGEGRSLVAPAIAACTPDDVAAWCRGLGQETFVGSSGRVFPRALKASPLLRAWLVRLSTLGVVIERRMCWIGWDGVGALRFRNAEGLVQTVEADATLLALGGASWPRLGSDGGWVPLLAAAGVGIAPLAPSNAGVAASWSTLFAGRFAGAPLKRIAVSLGPHRARGEAIVTRQGLEGGAIYALAAPLRQALVANDGAPVRVTLDLRPDSDATALETRLRAPRARQSLSNYLRKTIALAPVAIGLLREAAGRAVPEEPAALARLVKAVPVDIAGLSGLERAISTAGGVMADAVDGRFMLKVRPGVFVAGEMLDWDAPTGGYLLQATLATAQTAAKGIDAWLAERQTAASSGALREKA